MWIRILHDTLLPWHEGGVRAGTVMEVEQRMALRLIGAGVAEPVEGR